ncbi:sodium-coupled monocarboxylate transporter 1-like [Sitodiplosis mosellana]|uniref:sodium-coupled monocarboxylate transporter 1-like n=1 Tax=Sitodiplosis mosellana TaxID=263140 RepID=UPI002443F94E|nr:sodium-coupled monocarboxylate transporter 1-like [Sitodiplosis mosellana]
MSQYTEIPTTTTPTTMTISASSAQPAEPTSTNYLISTVRDNLINASEQHQQDDVNNFVFHFSWLDYGFFVGLLSISALIGIHYGFFSKHKQNNTDEYILGGRSMKILPVATSMIATHISGQTLVGLPTEIYSNGTQYVVFVITSVLLGLALAYIFLPLYHNLGVTSSFEYLERRFDRRIRFLATFVYTIKYILFTPAVIYVPALVFSQVSGLDLHYVTPVICAVCVFYTTIGGLRAVVCTDFIQFLLMLTAVIVIITLGTTGVGGFANVWSAAERGGRLILFNMDPSPFVRTSFWTILLSLTVNWMSNSGVGQTTVQRFLSVPDLHAARRSVLFFTIGMIFIKLLAMFLGLVIYATYEHCDPIRAGIVSRSDEIVSYYVVQIGQRLPGVAGLFIAGIFAAALSTMSSALNTLAGTIYSDVVKHCLGKQTEKQASNTMKWICVVLGIIVTILVFLVEKLGSVFQIGISIGGVFTGSFLSMFVLGMTSRSANAKGLIVGVIVSCSLLLVMMIGAQLNNIAKEPTLPVQMDGCSSEVFRNMTSTSNSTQSAPHESPIGPNQEVFWLFRISFMCYATIGFVVSIVVGQVVSWLSGGASQIIDENLLIPFFQSNEFKERMNRKPETRYATIDQMLIEMAKQSKSEQNVDDNKSAVN